MVFKLYFIGVLALDPILFSKDLEVKEYKYKTVSEQILDLREQLKQKYPIPTTKKEPIDPAILKRYKDLKFDWKKIYEESK